jgi:peptidoglycan hydrolase CwlO-like protein
MLSSKERNIVIIAALILVAWLVYIFSYKQPDYIDDHNNKIEILDLEVDSLHKVNKGLTLKIDSLNNQINNLDRQIGLKDNRIKTLKKITNEKVNAVDSFNNDELERFFTERYRHYSDSIKKTNSPSSN